MQIDLSYPEPVPVRLEPAKTMLLIDHDEPQVRIQHIVGEQGMGSHHGMQATILQVAQQFAPFRSPGCAYQKA